VIDFACTLYALAIEIDGGQHTAEGDAERTRYLKSEGWHVARFWNHDVLLRTESVKESLAATIANLKPRTLK
jgi:very-short-patch-repair endonuclease